MRLVDADEANKAIETVCNDYGIAYGNKYGGFADKIASVIDNIPTIDAEPVIHGKWVEKIEKYEDGFTDHTRTTPIIRERKKYVCSNCGREEFTPYDYCRCGAKMGGAEVEAKTDERNAVDKELMKSKIKTAMEDLLQRNCICDYVFVQNKQKIYQKNIYTLDAYMLAYDMATNGNVECYMAPNGEKAVKPVFTVIDGVITLSGLTIQ